MGVPMPADRRGAPTRRGGLGRLHLHAWSNPTVLGLGLVAFASGFGQFGAVAALGDVATSFGEPLRGATIADRAGLSGTELGLGLAVLRLASLGGLPLAGLADRLGRRTTLLASVAFGLLATALAAASPSYWWFVAIFAFGRPFLTATNGLAGVAAAEETSSADRSKAVALVAASYGVGGGLTVVLHGLGGSGVGFRLLFLLALVPLGLVGAFRHLVHEPDRFALAATRRDRPLPVLGAVGRRHRGRLGVVALLGFSLSVITGPANTFVFLYAQDIVHQPGTLTAAMVVAAGAAGFVGLVVGRFLADRLGRRPTCAGAMAAAAGFAVLAYSGSPGALVAGYVLGVFAGGVLAPGVGALVNELFPTSIRASVTGWWIAAGVAGAVAGLLAFGALADLGNRFGLAAAVTFLPAAAVGVAFFALPETKGREPEDLWPEDPGAIAERAGA